MGTPVRLSEQVEAFLKSLPPMPRRKLRDALRGLESGKGDIVALERDLSGYCRLKVPPYRVILHYESSSRGPLCFCDYAEMRDVVYEQFLAILAEERGS